MSFVSKKKNFLKKTENKRLFKNIFSLSVLQAANYILPLITVPYLVRVLGPDYFGLIAFATATTSYFVILTDYGFNLSATRKVSIHREDQDKINEIFSSVMLIKSGLMLLSILLFSVLIFSFDKFYTHWELYLICFGSVIGQYLFPVWLFQGMERMKYITYLNVFAKLIFTLCIFAFVKSQSDYLLVPLFTAFGFIISGILSLIIAIKVFNIRLYLESIQTIKEQLFEGWHVFVSKVSISVYTISTIFILGLLTNNTIVGYYAAADKIIQAVKGLYAPISQAMYPYVSKKMHENKQSGMRFIEKSGMLICLVMLLISTILFLFSEKICLVFLGEEFQPSIILLRVMAFLPFIISISNILAIQGLYNLGKASLVSKYVGIIALLHIFVASIFIFYFGILGAVIGILFTEILVTIVSTYYYRKELTYETPTR